MAKYDLVGIIDSFNDPTKTDFKDDKLAYFSLTKKVELELRDAIAYQIHRKLPVDEFVCREWKHIDAAVLDISNNPQLLIECKSHNSIDFPNFLVKKGESYPMAKDILKLKHHAQQNNPDLYFIFFNNVTKSTISLPTEPYGQDIFGFRSLVSRQIDLPYKDKVLIVFKNWVKLLGTLKLPLGLTTAVEIYAGTYRGIDASVIAFVYGPFKNNEVNTIPGGTFEGFDLDGIKPNIDNSDEKGDLDEISDFRYHDETLKDILSDLKKDLSYPPTPVSGSGIIHSEQPIQIPLNLYPPDHVFPIPGFTGSIKGLIIGDYVEFPAKGERRVPNPILIRGKIVKFFRNHNTGYEEAIIRGDDGKNYYRYEREITKL
jgi:hypothetical protein